MAPFTSREEYERWKAQRATAGQPDAARAGGARPASPLPPGAEGRRPWTTGLLAVLVVSALAVDGWYSFYHRPERARASVRAPAQVPSPRPSGPVSRPSGLPAMPPVAPEERDVLRSAAFAPDGKTLATGGFDGSVRLWDVASSQPRVRLGEHADVVFAVAFAPDGRTLASGGRDGIAKVWDVATGREQATLQGHQHWVHAVAIAPDSATVATGSFDGTVKLWDPRTGAAQATLDEGTGEVYAVAFSPDGTLLAWGGLDGAAILWDVAGGRTRLRLGGGQARTPGVPGWYSVHAIAFAPGGRTLATGAMGGTVRLWEVGTGRELGSLRVGSMGSVISLAFAPDSRKLLAGGKLWDLETRQPRPAVTSPGTRAAALAPDGTLLVTVGKDVRWWDAMTGLERSAGGTATSAGQPPAASR